MIMKKSLMLFLTIFFVASLTAQKIVVKSIHEIPQSNDGHNFHPVFSPDGKSLLTTRADFKGLSIYDLGLKKFRKITDENGAGYEVRMSSDSRTVFYRKLDYSRDVLDIHSKDLFSGEDKLIVSNLKELNGISIKQNELVYFDQGIKKTTRINVTESTVKSGVEEDVSITSEDLKIFVYRNGTKSLLQPFGPNDENHYVWTSLSPDKKKVLFTVGYHSYICSLDGKNLIKLEDIRSPKWLNNQFIIGMRDKDDGHEFTASEIVAIKSDGTGFQQLTNNSKEIKMFPSPSPDGKKIVFHSLKGKIYLMDLNY
jgi:Tol biopolymer transport system component